MDLRHLRCFIAVAEELHFARAAERLHIEQSPLSRAIKELEEDLGVRLFDRTTRSTRLTRAGQVFLEHVPRVFSALEQASNSIRAVAAGYQDQLRVALSDGITPPRLSALLAQCRQDDPDIEIRLFEIPLSQQIRGLNDELYDVGFAQSADVGDGIVAEAAWSDPLVVVMPARHPLLVHKRIPLDEVLRYPLVMCDPQSCEGYGQQIARILRRADAAPLIAEQVNSLELMLTLVAAGYALALVGASQVSACRNADVIGRPLAGRSPTLTTYLLRRNADPSETLSRFIDRVSLIGVDTPLHQSDITKEIDP
jgi:DNA-binding transcriptional LysR family regulator